MYYYNKYWFRENDINPEEKIIYECKICHEKHDRLIDANLCVYRHVKERCINDHFEAGYNLDFINRYFNIGLKLTEKQKDITKNSCFVIRHWQLCDNPAYQITHISAYGKIKAGGCGGWMGYCSFNVDLDDLKDPRPKKELFVYKK